jgi:hypothetical protein
MSSIICERVIHPKESSFQLTFIRRYWSRPHCPQRSRRHRPPSVRSPTLSGPLSSASLSSLSSPRRLVLVVLVPLVPWLHFVLSSFPWSSPLHLQVLVVPVILIIPCSAFFAAAPACAVVGLVVSVDILVVLFVRRWYWGVVCRCYLSLASSF